MSIAITIIISFLIVLVFSLAAAVFFVIRRLLYFSENTDRLLASIGQFSKHLEQVYNMETFYGEPVLQELLAHSKEVQISVDDFISAYSEGGGDSKGTEKEK